MAKQDSQDDDYTDGCIYTYSTSLILGSHTYHFAAMDNVNIITTHAYSGPTITNIPPTLTSCSVLSTNLPLTKIFKVTYTDAEGLPPSSIAVYIDDSGYTMKKEHDVDHVFTDGCVYTFTFTLTPGQHRYYFSCTDYSSTVNSTEETLFVGDSVLFIFLVGIAASFGIVVGIVLKKKKDNRKSIQT